MVIKWQRGNGGLEERFLYARGVEEKGRCTSLPQIPVQLTCTRTSCSDLSTGIGRSS